MRAASHTDPTPNIQTSIPTLRNVLAYPPQAESADAKEAGQAQRAASEAQQELDQLRSVNARLMRELAALQLREAEALRLADRDGLTGLFNRRRMLELLNLAIAHAARQQQFVGILFVDLNGFKAVNDCHGHAAGDRMLATVATRISARVRTADIVCRYGGDEFVVILPYLPEADRLGRIADAVRDRVALPYWINGQRQHLSAAIGGSIYPRDAVDAETLLHLADQDMYRRKTRADPSALDRRRDDKSKTPGGGDP